jgi:hypothetical protein
LWFEEDRDEIDGDGGKKEINGDGGKKEINGDIFARDSGRVNSLNI